MQGSKRAIYAFETSAALGVYNVPEGAIVLIENTNELYFKVDNVGLNLTSTVQSAIALDRVIPPENVWSYNNQGVGTNMDAALWGGHRLIEISVDAPTSADGDEGDIWFQRDA